MAEQQADNQAEQFRRQKEAEARVRALLTQVLEQDALERMSNIRLSNPELYAQLAQLLVTLAQQGRLQGKVSQTQLKALIEKIIGSRREPSITFKRK